MPLFRYKTISLDGRVAQGEAVAVSAAQLQEDLLAQGLRVQWLKPKQSWWPTGFRFGRRETEAFLLFNQEFVALLRAGLTVPEALKLASDRPDSVRLSQALDGFYQDLRKGQSLPQAAASRPEIFDALYLAALRTGERTGELATALSRYQVYLRQRLAVQRRLSQALAYPIFLLATLGVILVVLFVFVLPRFVSLYAELNAPMPLPTRVLMGAVQNGHWVALAIALAVVSSVWARRALVQNENWAARWDRWRDRLPWLGGTRRLMQTVQLSRALGALLAGGATVVEALNTVRDRTLGVGVTQRLRDVKQFVIEGKSLAQAFATFDLMPRSAVKMVQVGEATGRLDTMFDEIAQFYEERLETRLAKLTTLIEPALMLLIGVVVGGIIVTLYLPIFSLAEIVK